MKNVILALMLVFGLVNLSFAGNVGSECATGSCRVVQPRRVVTVTKEVVRSTVAPVRRVLSGPSCVNGTCRSRSVTVVR
jgi:hypothetical protein